MSNQIAPGINSPDQIIVKGSPDLLPAQIAVPESDPASVISTLLSVTGAKGKDVADAIGVSAASFSYYQRANGLSIVTLQNIASVLGYDLALVKKVR